MTERRPPSRASAERRHDPPASGAAFPASGEFRKPSQSRLGAAPVRSPAATRKDLPRYGLAPQAPPPPVVAPAPTSQSFGAGPRRFSTVEMTAVRADVEPDSSHLIGRMLDDELGFDMDFDLAADDGLELDDLPSSHRPRLEQPRSSSFEPTSAAWPSMDEPVPPSRPSPLSRSGHDAPPPSRGGAPPPSRNGGPPPPSRNGGAPPSRTSNRGMPAVSPPASSRTASQPALDTHASILAFAGYGTPPTSVVRMPGYALRVIRRRRTLKAELARARLRGSPDVGLYEAALRATDEGAVRTGLLVAGMMWTLSLLMAATVYQVMSSGLPFLR